MIMEPLPIELEVGRVVTREGAPSHAKRRGSAAQWCNNPPNMSHHTIWWCIHVIYSLGSGHKWISLGSALPSYCPVTPSDWAVISVEVCLCVCVSLVLPLRASGWKNGRAYFPAQ